MPPPGSCHDMVGLGLVLDALIVKDSPTQIAVTGLMVTLGYAEILMSFALGEDVTAGLLITTLIR